jgi:2-polyprenyl-6-methoxyphenol hydroxylase-like FAD-dependent oxidoreductase
MSRPTTALVIGGGIAGSATALALRRAGIEPVVCEARPAPADEGAMLTVASNGLAALRALGAEERVLEAAAFARYEAERRPRVERIARWAERIGSTKTPGPVGARIRDAVMPLVLRLTADGGKAQREIYDHVVAAPAEPALR